MKHLLFFLLTLSLPSLAQQGARRVYWINPNQIEIANSDGTQPHLIPFNQIAINTGATTISISPALNFYDSGNYYTFTPAQFLNSTGAVWGVSVASAYAAFKASQPGLSGNATTFGTVPPVITDYTGPSGAIVTTGVIRIVLENIGSSVATFTYGSANYNLLAGEQRAFTAILDPTTNKLSPYLSLSVNGTASTIRVVRTLTQ